jgi:excisionase family DNA binding protein
VKRNEFDPLAYIESAFLDNQKKETKLDIANPKVAIPTMRDYLTGDQPQPIEGDRLPVAKKGRFKKTQMSAPRPRRARGDEKPRLDPELEQVWKHLPKSVVFLTSYFDDQVTANYYGKGFRESRNDLIKRLLDPELSLEEAARLLGVCPATVRRYTNRGWLTHHRTKGGQRRFRLSGIVRFVDEHGRFPEE